MGIKDILVHLDDSVASESILDAAILYAAKHKANLRGLFHVATTYYGQRDLGILPTRERLETSFREKTAAAKVASGWITAAAALREESAADIVLMESYYSDLIIVGQPNPRTTGLNISMDLPEHLVKGSGRPVLVVPYAGSFETAGDRIMIAWRTGRESARSLADALPLLEKAARVSVVGINVKVNNSDENREITNVGNYLARHGVTAEIYHEYAGDLSIGDTILNLVCEQAATLLVMGACALNRRGALEFSPVARHVLKHLTVPVLFSH
jgi:nucleotide-binding universal stress UspA family protein